MSRANQIAGILADRHLEKFGIQKSAGGREALVRQYMPAAQLAAKVVKRLDRQEKALWEFRQACKRFRRYCRDNDGRLLALEALFEPAGNPEVPQYHPEALWAGEPVTGRARRRIRSITPQSRERSRRLPTRAITSSQAKS